MMKPFLNQPVRVLLWGALFAAGVGACGGSAAPPEPAQARAREPSPPVASALATAAATPGETAQALTAGEDTFVAVSELPYPVRLISVGDQVMGVALSAEAEGDALGHPMGLIVGDRLVDKPELRLKAFWAYVVAAVGTWPSGIDLLVTGTNGRTGIAEHHVLTADAGWSPRSATQGFYFAGAAKVGGSTLALQAPSMPWGPPPSFVTLRGPKVKKTLTPLDPSCARKLEADGWVPQHTPKSALSLALFGATSAGTMLALGSGVCSERPELEVWEAGSPSSRLVKLDGVVGDGGMSNSLIVTGRGEDEAYLFHFGAGYRFDKGIVTALPTMPAGNVLAAAVSGDGELLLVTEEKAQWDEATKRYQITLPGLVHRLAGARWIPQSLPAAPTGIASDAAGTVWVSAGTGLFRTRRSAAETSVALKSGAPAAAGQAKGAQRLLRNIRPAGPLCPSNLVVLYGFTKVTPDDFDFPATRKALKGRIEFANTRFVVAKDGGQKFFSAIVPSVATGRKLVTLIEKEVAGSKPQLLCAEPEIVRELDIDLATGELRKN